MKSSLPVMLVLAAIATALLSCHSQIAQFQRSPIPYFSSAPDTVNSQSASSSEFVTVIPVSKEAQKQAQPPLQLLADSRTTPTTQLVVHEKKTFMLHHVSPAPGIRPEQAPATHQLNSRQTRTLKKVAKHLMPTKPSSYDNTMAVLWVIVIVAGVTGLLIHSLELLIAAVGLGGILIIINFFHRIVAAIRGYW